MGWGKNPDESRIPLCWIHHRTGRDSYHNLGSISFSETHNLDILAISLRLISEHENKNASKEFMSQATRSGPAHAEWGK